MNELYQKNKIKIAIIGTGNWGAKVLNAASLFSRYELVGTINSSTPQTEKDEILNNADALYLALHSEHQMEYIKYGLDNKKHIITESPFLNSKEERKALFNQLIESNNKKAFYINYPYVQDQDFLFLCRKVMSLKANYVSLKVSGPNNFEDELKAKKIYSTQAIYLIIFLHQIMGKDKLESFNILDNYKGYIKNMNGNTYEFSWGISEKPELEFIFKTDKISETHKIVYDQYDQIIPLLTMISNHIYNIYPSPNMEYLPEQTVNDIWEKMFATAYLYGASAEYFSDIFTNINQSELPFSVTNPSNLYLNGGF
jgi:hypothetical protein